MSKHRAQVWNGERWIDGVLATTKRTAEVDAERMADLYARPVRVVEVGATPVTEDET